MTRVLTVDGSVKIGAYRLPDRDKRLQAAERSDREKKITAYNAAYRQANKEKIAAHHAAYRQANKEKKGEERKSPARSNTPSRAAKQQESKQNLMFLC